MNGETKFGEANPSTQSNAPFEIPPLVLFQIAITSEGAETEAKFHQSLIKNPKVNFRPGMDLKEMLATLQYTKISGK